MITDVDTYLSDALFTNTTTAELREMIDVKSDWFLLDARVDIADRERRLYNVLHRQGRAVSVVHRTEGDCDVGLGRFLAKQASPNTCSCRVCSSVAQAVIPLLVGE